MTERTAKFTIGQIVRHRIHPFRGVIYDVDPIFNNTEDWYRAIPAHLRPPKNQPFYHLYAENSEGPYEAYVSEQNLLLDGEHGPVGHPKIKELFSEIVDGCYRFRPGAFSGRLN